MNKNKMKFAGTIALAMGMLIIPAAKADCGIVTGQKNRIFDDSVATAMLKPAAVNRAAQADASPRALAGAGNSVVGLWLTTFTSQGQIVDQGFDLWSADGGEVLNDTPPPATGNVCLGTWVKTGPNSYLLKHPSWTFDDAGNLNGMAIIREQISVDPAGATFSGTFTVDVVTLSGSELQHIAGTIKATRVTVD